MTRAASRADLAAGLAQAKLTQDRLTAPRARRPRWRMCRQAAVRALASNGLASEHSSLHLLARHRRGRRRLCRADTSCLPLARGRRATAPPPPAPPGPQSRREARPLCRVAACASRPASACLFAWRAVLERPRHQPPPLPSCNPPPTSPEPRAAGIGSAGGACGAGQSTSDRRTALLTQTSTVPRQDEAGPRRRASRTRQDEAGPEARQDEAGPEARQDEAGPEARLLASPHAHTPRVTPATTTGPEVPAPHPRTAGIPLALEASAGPGVGGEGDADTCLLLPLRICDMLSPLRICVMRRQPRGMCIQIHATKLSSPGSCGASSPCSPCCEVSVPRSRLYGTARFPGHDPGLRRLSTAGGVSGNRTRDLAVWLHKS